MAQRFWQQAERDIETARFNLQPRCYYAAADFAHQAAEKALKAAHWYVRGEEPPWIHELGRCLERVAPTLGETPAQVNAAIGQLEPIFDRSRYPSAILSQPIPAELVQEADARAAIAAAEDIVAWVQTLLLQPISGSQPKKN
ncbi:MAG: HEPN domain-containing protein [Chloroflexi bacterium]|nr:HEPN domain-containing protein [Chloroflexota bacterium]